MADHVAMDYDKIYKLLRIVEITRGYPALQAIGDECTRQVEAMAKDVKTAVEKKAAPPPSPPPAAAPFPPKEPEEPKTAKGKA